jgi:hypothetical protein
VGRLTATVWLDAWRVTISTWPSDVRRLCDGLVPRSRKTLTTKEKEDKMEQNNRMKTNSKRSNDWPLEMYDHCTVYRQEGIRITIYYLRKYKIAIADFQETRWNKLTSQAFTSNGYYIYTSSLANNHDVMTRRGANIDSDHMLVVIKLRARICRASKTKPQQLRQFAGASHHGTMTSSSLNSNVCMLNH